MRAVLACSVMIAFAVGAASPLTGQWGGPERALAWSPDGSCLLFEPDGWMLGAACHWPATGRSELLLSTDWGLRHEPPAFAWTEDGRTAVVAHHVPEPPATILVHCIPIADPAQRRSFAVTNPGIPDRRAKHAQLSLVVRGDTLFLGAGGLVRIDVRTGAVTARAPFEQEADYRVLHCGAGIAYAACPGSGSYDPWGTGWNVGSIDAATLTTAHRMRFPGLDRDGRAAVPWPAFAPDGAGFAVAVYGPNTEACDVQVRRGDVLVATLPVLPAAAGDSHCGHALGNVAWSADGGSLWVGSERYDGASHWSLWQLPLAGGPAREIPLADGGRTRCIGACNPPALALASDGRHVAVAASGLRPKIVDTVTAKVRDVPVLPTPIVMHTTPRLTPLVAAWQQDLAHLAELLPMTCHTGADAAGRAALLEGTADVVITERGLRDPEHAAAARGFELTTTRLGTRLVWLRLHPSCPTPIAWPLWAVARARSSPGVEGLVQYLRRSGGDRHALWKAGFVPMR